MKRAIATCAVTLFVAGSASAASIRDNCGCGIGTMALADAEPTLIVQLGATFLNGICGNQTFGITSGTLECEPHIGFASNKRILEYVDDNMDHLAMEMAAGQGESLDALADLMEIHKGLGIAHINKFTFECIICIFEPTILFQKRIIRNTKVKYVFILHIIHGRAINHK